MSSPRLSPHNHVAVVATTFLILAQERQEFLRLLAARCTSLSPLLVARIGGVMNYLVLHRVIPDTGAVDAIQGTYPVVRAQNGDLAGAVYSVQNALGRLSIPRDLKMAMECTVGVQTDMLMLGFDKVLGQVTGTMRNASGNAKLAQDTYSYTMRGFDAGKKIDELRGMLKKTPNPVDTFVACM